MPELVTRRTRSVFHRQRVHAGTKCVARWLLAALILGCLPLASLQSVAAQSINDQRPARIVAPPAALLDINRASLSQLMRIPGITQSYAQRIIGGRPYANKGQLETKGILPPQVYQAAKHRLIAHRVH